MNKPRPLDIATHPLDAVTLIEASAGTGKTWTITQLYLRVLLERQLDIKQILVVTFTHAATQELRQRIRELLHELLVELSSPSVKDPSLDALYGRYRLQPSVVLQLQQALVNFDMASIFSIHGFCQRVLNSYPVETGALLEQKIIADQKEILLAAVRDYWRRHINNQPPEELKWILKQWSDPQQLMQDVAIMLQDFDSLDHAITDETEIIASWQQCMQQWKKQREQIEALLLHSGIFNKISYKPAQLTNLIAWFDANDTDAIPNELPDKKHLLTPEKMLASLLKGKSDDRIELEFFQLIARFIKQHSHWLQQKKRNLLLAASIAVYDSIGHSKRQSQNISFDDLISQLSDALKTGNEHLRQKILDNWPMAMVDEFQDTDQRQYHIFKTLYHDSAVHNPRPGLILIGDPKQAIYRFRGADVFTYQQAKQATSGQFTLAVNYRSSAEYVDMVNQLFQRNPQAFVFRQLIEFYPSLANTAARKTLHTKNAQTLPPLKVWLSPYSDKAMNKDDANICFASTCANEIASILNEQSLLLDGEIAQAKDMAILVRTGKQASLMKQQLAARGIASALVLRDSVFASAQAREITRLLEVLIDPSSIARLNGLLVTDLFGYNAQQIEQLQNDNQQLVELIEVMRAYRQCWIDNGILSMFFKLLGEQSALARIMAMPDGERSITNWLHIVELLQQQSSAHASLSQALHWLKQQRQQAQQSDNEEHQLRLESDRNLVRIVTIHKSKGLQYPLVFLPFMWSVSGHSKLPACYRVHDDDGAKQLKIFDDSGEVRWQQENLAEEVRLLYVAMTRAIYRCYVGFGHVSDAGRSALAQCLFAGLVKKNRRAVDLDIHSQAELIAAFERFNEQARRVEICAASAADEQQHVDSQVSAEPLTVREFNRRLVRQWRITSYSQLALSASAEHVDRPDYDAVQSVGTADDEDSAPSLSRFSFEKGAKAGNFLHELLEHQPFDQAVDENLIRQKCAAYGYDEKWLPCLTDWITDVLNTDLNGFALNRLRSSQCINELEFYMSCSRLKAAALNQLLFEHDYSQTPDSCHFNTISGYLKGFIDLIFEYDGQYFVADYKSNFLGSTVADYNAQNCRQAMFEHHYHLQYLIYTLALHRYLKQRLKDYDYERDIGGVYYLFLRGMSSASGKGSGYGIFFDKPSVHFIEQLDQLFCE